MAGEINLDLILYGLPSEMPMERELLASRFEVTLGSSSAILAHNLATLGTSVTFTTRVGGDDLGRIALERLSQAEVDLSRVTHATNDTATGVTIVLPHSDGRHMFTYPGTMAEMGIGDLDLEHLAQAQHFHLSSPYLQTGLLPDVGPLFRRLREAGLTISLDTNDDPDDRWENLLDGVLPWVDVLLPNESEACRMTRTSSVEEAIERLGAIVPTVAVKCGSRGALVRHAGKTQHVDPLTVEPVDTVGAGDSFNAGFLHAWLLGAPAALAARAGNITGAFSTLRSGGTEAFRDVALRNSFFERHPLPLHS
ncbi:MAG: carbohydrate kinase family protein [Edaphobacter sp.]|uniref:carbohydrate kinase family protein n=1 Tax=Edaphobacter sp. TaxID=1934404 RepID=UPI00239DDFB7|nr:carbohydrate kinase family protein [Edaphobacter sp.]MDE1176454.1 carbohydrate kinase family protein [Edaphobacter sp.]